MRVAVLCSPCLTTNILLSYLTGWEDSELIVLREASLPSSSLIKHRLRKLGLVTVIGQVAFKIIVPRLQARRTRRRTAELLQAAEASEALPDGLAIVDVETINSSGVKRRLQKFAPDVVIVNGTRIIRKKVLSAVDVPFINIHAGITPQYRGVHGGYWALYCNDAHNFGSTIHIVDPGVDTGDVLAHVRTKPGPEDNFSTYPLVQFLAALPQLKAILSEQSKMNMRSVGNPLETTSRQWYHPTLLQYFLGYWRGVK